MKSHEYAKRLHEIAEFLESRPEFETPMGVHLYQYSSSKAPFLAAAKALGNVTKEYRGDDLRISPAAFPEMIFAVPRSVVCRLVKPAEYDCEPLLSQEEEASLSA